MTDEPSSLSQRAETRAKARARRAKRIERREAFFDLVASGYSHRQIATAMKVSLATVHPEVDNALAERPLHAPERHASLQVARLTKALLHADFSRSKPMTFRQVGGRAALLQRSWGRWPGGSDAVWKAGMAVEGLR